MDKKPTYQELELRIKELERESVERKQTEKALRESEEKHRTLFETMALGVVYQDKNGRIISTNPSAKRILGLTLDQMLGRTSMDPTWHAIHEDGSEFPGEMHPAMVAIHSGEEIKNVVMGVFHPLTDEYRWINIHAVPLFRPEENAPYQVYTTFDDITDRKHSEQIVRDSEQKFKNIVESSPMGIHLYKLEPDGRLVFMGANPSADSILGIDNKRFIGKTIEEAFPPLINTEVPERYRLACSKGQPWMNEHFNYEHDQIIGTYEVYAFQTAPGMMAAFFLDITERMKTQAALQQSEERYRSLIENTLAGYFICEIPSGHFIFLNQRICDLSGFSMHEGLSLKIWDVIDPEEHRIIKKRIKERMEGKKPIFDSNIYNAIRKDGSKLMAEVSTSLVTYHGKPVIQGVLRDVTEEQRLQMQLQQAQKMEAIGTLAGGIAHDFNNLLMGIQGRASLMMADIDSSHAFAEHLKGIEEYIKSATDLTKQLLGFARGGKYEIKPTDLNNLIKKSSLMFGRTRKEIKIHQKFQQDLWTTEVDQRQIEQVLLNMFVNAWQAMPAGGDLYLQTENKTLDENFMKPHIIRPGNYVKISITDTGVGMGQATLEKIFDPFFTTKELGRGTGLGLASAYGIIKNHGGIINVCSKKGEGTSFDIYLPGTEKEVVKEPKLAGEFSIGTETVLLVDDEQIVIDVSAPMLEKLGYKVIAANDGKSAIDLYREKSAGIDIVILDMIMPDINGGEVYDHLKEINPNIKVVLSSGYSLNGLATEILNRGCNGFIQKPFNMVDLSRKINEILNKK